MSSRSSTRLVTAEMNSAAGRRPSRRAALGRWWTASTSAWSGGLGKTALPSALGPFGPVACDGTDVWVGAVDRVFRIRASDGKLLEEWSIPKAAGALLVAMGRVFVAGSFASGRATESFSRSGRSQKPLVRSSSPWAACSSPGSASMASRGFSP